VSELRFHTINPSTIEALMTNKTKTITIGELRTTLEHLQALPDETEVFFGQGDLRFYRIKPRHWVDGEPHPRRVQIEFNEVYEVTIDPEADI
jgi:hypothetical protein